MEKITYLEQFKQEIQKLIYDNINELSKVVVLNTPTYQGIIRHLLGEVTKEAELNNLEAQYLIEIRKQWQLHLFFLDSVRITYDHLKYQKLPRPKAFNDLSLPAYLELKGSVIPSENPYVVYNEQQQIYYQYLEFAKKLEGALIAIEVCLSEELEVKTNFEELKDNESGAVYTDCKLGNEFMIDLVFIEDSNILKKITEAEEFIKSVLDPIYTNANRQSYDWLIKSILYFSFQARIKIPNIKTDNHIFSLIHSCPNVDLYRKIKLIKNKICPHKTGRKEYLADLLLTCTKNLEGKKCLQKEIILNKI